MEISCLINTHDSPDLTYDTASSVKVNMTDRIVIIVDGIAWNRFSETDSPFSLYKGLTHGQQSSPYRNVLYGLSELYRRFVSDWYCYLEYDCLIANSDFMIDLEMNKDKWFCGTNYKYESPWEIPVLNEIVRGNVQHRYYVLGAVQFVSYEFMKKLIDDNLIEQILEASESCPPGQFPGYCEYAFEEQLLVSLANYYRPNSCFSLEGKRYVVRFKHDISMNEITESTSIIHPAKNFNSPVRQHLRRIRSKADT